MPAMQAPGLPDPPAIEELAVEASMGGAAQPQWPEASAAADVDIGRG